MNREEFDAQTNAVISYETSPGSIMLAMLQIRNFAEINTKIGRITADDLLRHVAECIQESLANVPEAITSRRHGADFAIFIPHTHLDKSRTHLQSIFQSVASLQFFTEDTNLDSIHVGASFHERAGNLSIKLTSADTALRNAQAKGANATYFLIHGDSDNPISDIVKRAQEWKLTLDKIIKTEDILFYYQPIFSLPNKTILAYEIFVRIELAGKIINAGVFMPMAERFGLLVDLDKIIISKALKQLKDNSPKFFLNLSPRSIQDVTFVDWLISTLEEYRAHSNKITFEIPEYSIHLAYEHVKRLINSAAAYDYKFSIDHFGNGATALSYLQSIDAHYLKIDRSFVTGISDNTDNQFFIKSVVQIARTRDMLLIAEGIEESNELETLIELEVDTAMGYLLGKPGPNLG